MRKESDTCLNVNRVRFTFNGILLKFGDERIFLSQFFDEPFLNPVSYLIPYETSKLSISNILFGDMMLLLIGAGGIFFYYIKRKEEVLWI